MAGSRKYLTSESQFVQLVKVFRRFVNVCQLRRRRRLPHRFGPSTGNCLCFFFLRRRLVAWWGEAKTQGAVVFFRGWGIPSRQWFRAGRQQTQQKLCEGWRTNRAPGIGCQCDWGWWILLLFGPRCGSLSSATNPTPWLARKRAAARAAKSRDGSSHAGIL